MSTASQSPISPTFSESSTLNAYSFLTDDEEAGLNKGLEPMRAQRGLHPALHIANWIFFSNVTILFNKWLIDSAGFPILLTCWHLIFSAVATQMLARWTSLLDSRHSIPMTSRVYMRTVCPIGVFYSASLVCSNLVYLYLSVAFIQMLKSAAPVAVLFTAWAWGVASPSMGSLVNILVIVAGVSLASLGEIHFSLAGFLFQVGGIVFEAIRIVMIQVMLSGDGLKMDPLVGLYYYAPVCAAMNLLVALLTEIPRFQWEDVSHVGFGVLFLNALAAFLLNVASVFLIGKTSGLVITLAGILKNILVIAISIIIWHTRVTLAQAFGYTIALAGLTYYSLDSGKIPESVQAVAVRLPLPSMSWPLRKSVSWATLALVSCLAFLATMRRYGAVAAHSQPAVWGHES